MVTPGQPFVVGDFPDRQDRPSSFSLLARERGGYGAFISQLSGFVDGYITEDHEGNVRTTRLPIETGASLTDHAVVEPRVITLDGWVSDVHQYKPREAFESPVQTFPTVPLGERAGRASQELERLRVARTPIEIYTHLGRYENMLLIRVRERTGANTGRGMRCTLEFQKIDFVDLTRREFLAVEEEVETVRRTTTYPLTRFNDLRLWRQPFLTGAFVPNPPPRDGRHEFPFVEPKMMNIIPLIRQLEQTGRRPGSRLSEIIGGFFGRTDEEGNARRVIMERLFDQIQADHGDNWQELKLDPVRIYNSYFASAHRYPWTSDESGATLQPMEFHRLSFASGSTSDVHIFTVDLVGLNSFIDHLVPVTGTHIPFDASRYPLVLQETRTIKLTFSWIELLGIWQLDADWGEGARTSPVKLGQKLIDSPSLPVDVVVVPVFASGNERYTARAANPQSALRQQLIAFDDDGSSPAAVVPLSFTEGLGQPDALAGGNYAVLILDTWQSETWAWPPRHKALSEYASTFSNLRFTGSDAVAPTAIPEPVFESSEIIAAEDATTVDEEVPVTLFLWLSPTDAIPNDLPPNVVSGTGALRVPDYVDARYVFLAQRSEVDDITGIYIRPGPGANDITLFRPKRTIQIDRTSLSVWISIVPFGFTLSGSSITVAR